MAQKRKMPHENKIKREWENKFRFIEDFGWDELPTNACWKCGKDGYVERAHIWKRMCSFDDSPSNLHLLCSKCHNESEHLSGFEPGLAYYEWFYSVGEFDWMRKLMDKCVPQEVKNKIKNMDTMEGAQLAFSYIRKQLDIWNEQEDIDGKMIFDEERHDRFKKLSKEKGEEYTNYMIHEGIF